MPQFSDTYPYFNPKYCAQLFADVTTDDIKIEIVTSYQSNLPDRTKTVNMLKSVCKTLNKRIQKCSLTAYVYNYAPWHDRFLIIDAGLDSEAVYLVGASMDDQVETKRSHGIGIVTDSCDADLIINKFESCRDGCNSDGNHKVSMNLPLKY